MYTGNAASSMFGGFGGCALIPNTILNNRQGGESYVSSLAYAFSILLSVLLFAPMIGQVPMAALAGMCLYSTMCAWVHVGRVCLLTYHISVRSHATYCYPTIIHTIVIIQLNLHMYNIPLIY